MATKVAASPRIAALEAELALTRRRLGRDLSAVRAKATPAGLAQEAGSLLQGTSENRQGNAQMLGAVGREPSLWRSVARSSPALTLLGAGLAWLLLRSSRPTKEVM